MRNEALKELTRWFQKSRLAARAYSCQKFAGSKQRVALFEAYGGSDWMTLLLALGAAGINEDLLECYNEEIDRRTPGGAHGVEPHFANCDRLSERSLAAARGEELPKVRGVRGGPRSCWTSSRSDVATTRSGSSCRSRPTTSGQRPPP